jgi:sugar lactone lactonase YvrE
MKRNHPVLHFLFVLLALGFLTGYETTTGVGTQDVQDSGERGKTVKVSTIAGRGQGFADGIGGDAKFDGPFGIAIDAAGNLYVADFNNSRIRKITPAGEVSTFGGESDYANNIKCDGKFRRAPSDIAIDAAGNLYVADSANSSIRKIIPVGEVRYLDDFARDAAGNLYVADINNNHIRKITAAGEVNTIADNWKDFFDGIGSNEKFYRPHYSIAMDTAGNLYVSDYIKNSLRMIITVEGVSTLVGGDGSDARVDCSSGIALYAADGLYVADIFAGGEEGFADGIGRDAKFERPSGIAIDAAGNLYVADGGNHRIRKITPAGKVSTLAGGEEGFADGIGRDAKFREPSGITIDTVGNLYVADSVNNRIRKITPAGKVSTIAGGERGFADGIGGDASFYSPTGIAIDAVGNLYVADAGNNRIRKVTPAGEVSTLAGGKRGFTNGFGSYARFNGPVDIAIDAAGNLYVADTWNHRIRKIEIRRP